MNNDSCKHATRLRKLVRAGRRGWAHLVAGCLIGIAAMALVPCLAQTATSQPAASSGVEAADDLQRILAVKDSAVELADQRYSEWVDLADRNYEQSLLKARTSWSGKVSSAKLTAVTDLKVLGSRLAAAGRLGETVNVLKAVYTIEPADIETVKALATVGVDIKTIPPDRDYVAARDGGKASKIVIWNIHNGRYNTSGALQCNVVLYQAGKPVWRADKVDLPWERDKDTFAVVNVPARQFDVVRVEIVKWRGYSGGLAEIEIWQGGRNVALRMPTRASAAADGGTSSARATDGVTTSAVYKNGYWLLPDGQAGWIEIRLSRPAYQKLLRVKIFARTPWQKTLDVVKGDIIDITADGKWLASPELEAGPEGGVDPGGDQWGKFRDRFYLQGRLGEKVFKIGSKFTYRAETSGQLELGMNEEKLDWYRNNSGFLDVTVSVRKRQASPKSGTEGIAAASVRRKVR